MMRDAGRGPVSAHKERVIKWLAHTKTWRLFMFLSCCSYLSLLLFEESSDAWRLWWGPSKLLGLIFALLCVCALIFHIVYKIRQELRLLFEKIIGK